MARIVLGGVALAAVLGYLLMRDSPERTQEALDLTADPRAEATAPSDR